jgi:carboxymethylenebutenolidase
MVCGISLIVDQSCGFVESGYNSAMASSTPDSLSDLRSLLRETEPENRRTFLAHKLAVGFALAVHPIGAQTIQTDTTGLTAGEVKIPTADGQIPAYRACPAKGRAFPVVLVVQEIFGVHEHIKDLCRRLAKAGYCAVAPELYARQGDVSKIENVQEIISRVVSKVPDAQVMSDLDATAAWAAKSSKGSPGRMAVTGFCWGGRISWLYAAHNPHLKAAAAWYGQIEGNHTPLTPKFPIDYAGALKCPVIGFYGGKDTGITQESLDRMRTALKVISDPSEIDVYPEAQHGFNADYRPSYSKADAEDAWKKMLAWFKRNGV